MKSSSDPSHFIFEINVGTSRKEADMIYKFNFRVVLYRIRLFPALILTIKCLGSELPLTMCPHGKFENHTEQDFG